MARAAGSKTRIKIGQIGTAHPHARGKIETIRKFSDDFELVGVVEENPERRAAAAQKSAYQDVPWMTEEELLNVPGLEAVAVETSVENLVPAAKRCIAAGAHVHLDKPAGDSLTEFQELLDSAAKKGLVVQMGYMLRYNPAFQLCYRAVREGWLGSVFEVHAVMSKTVGQDQRDEMAVYEGGAMFDLGCHLIDSLVYLLGVPDKVTAHIRRTHPERDNLADNTLAVFDYPKATATIRSAVIEPFGFARRQFVVCGKGGVMDIRPLEPPVLRMALTEPREGYAKDYQDVELPQRSGRYDGDFTDLAQIIRDEKEPDFTPAHDLAVQKAVLQACDLPLR